MRNQQTIARLLMGQKKSLNHWTMVLSDAYKSDNQVIAFTSSINYYQWFNMISFNLLKSESYHFFVGSSQFYHKIS